MEMRRPQRGRDTILKIRCYPRESVQPHWRTSDKIQMIPISLHRNESSSPSEHMFYHEVEVELEEDYLPS